MRKIRDLGEDVSDHLETIQELQTDKDKLELDAEAAKIRAEKCDFIADNLRKERDRLQNEMLALHEKLNSLEGECEMTKVDKLASKLAITCLTPLVTGA